MVQCGVPFGEEHQPKLLEPNRGHGLMSRWAMGRSPPAFPAGRRRPRTILRNSQAFQELRDRLGPLPLFQPHATQFAANPTVQFDQMRSALLISVVRHPPGQKQIEFAHHAIEALNTISPGDLTDAILHPLQILGGDRQRSAGCRKLPG